MLYPKEDEDSHKLQFTCRTCQYTEDAHSSCIFRNELNNSAGETAGVTQDVGSDPTVSRDLFLPSTATAATAAAFLCLCCGDVVRCNGCGETAPELVRVASGREKEMVNGGSVDWSKFDALYGSGEDPFAEYDEELMEDVESESMDTDTSHVGSCATSLFDERYDDDTDMIDS